MYRFLSDNRDELIARCTSRMGARTAFIHSDAPLVHGVPMLLAQLVAILGKTTLVIQQAQRRCACEADQEITETELKESARINGGAMLTMGYSLDDVVRSYGDLCQSITGLAFERHASFTVSDFGCLNRCLDEAIAQAVTAFSQQRVELLLKRRIAVENEKQGYFVHEIRNALHTATYAVRALEIGNMTLSGATGTVLKRTLAGMTELISRSQEDVRADTHRTKTCFSVADFVAEAQAAAQLYGQEKGAKLVVPPVDSRIFIRGNRERLSAALTNLLQNAFKFTRAGTAVTLKVTDIHDTVHIEVFDHCGGLSEDSEKRMFEPFAQFNGDKSGLGLGLAIAKQGIEEDLGNLSVRSISGVGCVFKISLPVMVEKPIAATPHPS